MTARTLRLLALGLCAFLLAPPAVGAPRRKAPKPKAAGKSLGKGKATGTVKATPKGTAKRPRKGTAHKGRPLREASRGWEVDEGAPRRATRPGKASRSSEPLALRPGEVEGPEALEGFFARLRELEAAQGRGADPVARVLHFGDSHTAADHWTGRLRQALQARFGDGGPGLLLPARPWRGYHHAGVNQDFGRDWAALSLRSRECDGLVGLTGAALLPPPGEPLRIRATFRAFQVQVLGPRELLPSIALLPPQSAATLPPLPTGDPLPPPSGPSEERRNADPFAPLPALNLVERQRPLEGAGLLRRLDQAPLPLEGPVELDLTLPEGLRLLGVDLRSGRPGVIYDELGLNGAELPDLERWNPALRRELLSGAAPSLIVLAYGTNDMGRKDLDPEGYRTRAAALMAALRAESGAAVLVVGPVDRGARRRRQLPALRTGARTVIAALRRAARESGCAFWDARQAMGGEGAIQRWRRQGLAQADLVHLTGPGYQRMGDLQFQALMNAYDSFKKASE